VCGKIFSELNLQSRARLLKLLSGHAGVFLYLL